MPRKSATNNKLNLLQFEPGPAELNIARYSLFFQAEDGIRDYKVTGVQTCALPISRRGARRGVARRGAGTIRTADPPPAHRRTRTDATAGASARTGQAAADDAGANGGEARGDATGWREACGSGLRREARYTWRRTAWRTRRASACVPRAAAPDDTEHAGWAAAAAVAAGAYAAARPGASRHAAAAAAVSAAAAVRPAPPGPAPGHDAPRAALGSRHPGGACRTAADHPHHHPRGGDDGEGPRRQARRAREGRPRQAADEAHDDDHQQHARRRDREGHRARFRRRDRDAQLRRGASLGRNG